jgi:hypothetical protein
MVLLRVLYSQYTTLEYNYHNKIAENSANRAYYNTYDTVVPLMLHCRPSVVLLWMHPFLHYCTPHAQELGGIDPLYDESDEIESKRGTVLPFLNT